MHQLEGRLLFAATDLSNFLACPHLTLLNRRTALGGPKPRQFDDPALDVLRRRGEEHEAQVLARLRDNGQRSIADLTSDPDERPSTEIDRACHPEPNALADPPGVRHELRAGGEGSRSLNRRGRV